MDKKYRVIRMFRDAGKKRKVILKHVSLEAAQLHCRSPLTHKVDKEGNVIWFDGYEEEAG
jgi:hypothetical protein